jgi:hypothetical protein
MIKTAESKEKGGIDMAEENKCGHDACSCQALGESKYCSDHCKDAVEQDIIEIACDCGHSGC